MYCAECRGPLKQSVPLAKFDTIAEPCTELCGSAVGLLGMVNSCNGWYIARVLMALDTALVRCQAGPGCAAFRLLKNLRVARSTLLP